MTRPRIKPFQIQDLESVNRITNLPLVETGWNYAENMYNRIKRWNHYIYWTLDQAEHSVHNVFEAATPALTLIQGPLVNFDKLVCMSLDIVEHAVPQITQPPESIYINTKRYVSDVGKKIATPVLRRAQSAKQLGITVLDSKYSAFAIDTLDDALNVAEKYVDKYFPADDDLIDYEFNHPVNSPKDKALYTVLHAKDISKKLKRRLTKKTISEIQALKQQSFEAVQAFLYVAELIATDPIVAFQKGKELWAKLSEDGPKSLPKPENLEQLIVLLTKEAARRIVHLVNLSRNIIRQAPNTVSTSVTDVVRGVNSLTNTVVKTIHLEEVQQSLLDNVRVQGYNLVVTLKHLNTYFSGYLDQVVENLAKPEPQKSALVIPQIKVQPLKATHAKIPNSTNSKSNINGLENNL